MYSVTIGDLSQANVDNPTYSWVKASELVVLVFLAQHALTPHSDCTVAGKQVVQLEYEAYNSMAMKQLLQICASAREKWPICKMAIAHRTG